MIAALARRLRARKVRQARMDAAVMSLEHAAQAAQAERKRLCDAVLVTHQALALLHDRLRDLVEQPARAAAAAHALEDAAKRALEIFDDVDAKIRRRMACADLRAHELLALVRADLHAAASTVAETTNERIAQELKPARAAAEAHADWLRASLDRMRGESAALGGAQDAAAALVTVTAAAQAEVCAAVDALARRADRAGNAAACAADSLARAASRIDGAAERLGSTLLRREVANKCAPVFTGS